MPGNIVYLNVLFIKDWQMLPFFFILIVAKYLHFITSTLIIREKFMKGLARNFSFHIIFRIIAIPLVVSSLLIILFMIQTETKFHLETITLSGSKELKIFYDFDKDGFSETVAAYYDTTFKSGHITVVKHNSNPINEWKINGYTSLEVDKRKQWIEFGDINHDNFDDIIVFVQEKDSLFLYVIDVKNSENNLGKYLIKHSFLLKRPFRKSNEKWDIYYFHHAIVDLDNNGQKELIFTIVSGHSRKPRGIFIYDFNQQKITYRYETNASLMDMNFFDLNHDGKKEIIVNTYASGNFSPEVKESDFYSWIFVFDRTLRPIFKPIQLYGFTSTFLGIGIKEKDKYSILGFISDVGKSDQLSSLVKIDSKGNILRKVEIPTPSKWYPYLYQINEDSLIIIAKNESEEVRLYDHKFNLLRHKRFPGGVNFLKMVDLNNDGQKEIIGIRPFKLVVFDSYLNSIAQTDINIVPSHISVSIGQNGFQASKYIRLSSKNFNVDYVFVYLPLIKNTKILTLLTFWFLLVLFLLFVEVKGSEVAIRWNFLPLNLTENSKVFLIIDDKGRVLFHNTSLLTSTNLKYALMKKQFFHTGLVEYPQLVQIIERAIQDHNLIRHRLWINEKKYIISIFPIRIWSALIVGYSVQILRDEFNCMDEKTKIWTNTIKKLAHDIKTPLSNIDVGVQTVRDNIIKTKLPDKNVLVEDLEVLSNEVRRITSMLSSFLKFVNLEKPHFQFSSIHQTIRKSANNFAAYWKTNFTIDFEFDQQIPFFHFDPQQMEIVMNNLIKNALDALRDKGKIVIRTTLLSDEIDPKVNHHCEIEVVDNGPGISKEKQRYIFDPNFSEKKNGNGLGLTIVKKIIEDHDGHIKVFSTQGLGTTFRIILPIKSV